MRRGELLIGGSVVFTTILRVVTTQNTGKMGKFRRLRKIGFRTGAPSLLNGPETVLVRKSFERDQLTTGNHNWHGDMGYFVC